MKFYNTFSFIVLLCSSPSWAKSYTLNDLIELGKKNNTDKKIEQVNIKELDSKIEKEQSDYYPKLSITLGSESRKIESDEEIKQSKSVAELRLDYNLYRFGATSKKVEAYQALKTHKKRTLKYFDLKQKQELKGLFYRGLYYANLYSILQQEQIFNKQLKKEVTRRKKQGLVGQADVLEIDMREATLKDKILSTQEKMDHNKDQLREALFLSHTFEFELNGHLPHLHLKTSTKELIAQAYHQNKELSHSLAKLESLRHDLLSRSSQKWPSIDIKGRYGKLNLDDAISESDNEGQLGVYLNIPLWDGGKRSANINLAKARQNRHIIKHERLEKNLKIEVVHKHEKMLNLHARVDLAEQNVKNGKRYFANVRKEYARGIKNSLDLVSARDRLMNFEKDLIWAKNEFLQAKITLENLIGKTIQ